MGIFDKIKALKGVEDFDTAIAEITRKRDEAQSMYNSLSSQRETELFERGEAGLAKLDKEAAEIQQEVARYNLALGGLEKRRAAANEIKEKTETEEFARKAKADIFEEHDRCLRQYHKHAAALASITDKITDLERQAEQTNAALKVRGRPDLMMGLSYSAVTRALQEEAKSDGSAYRIGDEWVQLPWPVAAPQVKLNIPGYFEAGRIAGKQPFRFA